MNKNKFAVYAVTAMLGSGLVASAAETQFTDRDLQIGSEKVGSVMAGRDVTLDGTIVSGNVLAGRGVEASDCQVSGNLSGGRDVSLRGCTSVRAVQAGRDLTLGRTTVEEQVSAGRALNLNEATVRGNASAGGEVVINRSQVEGVLTTGAPYLSLTNSTVNGIRVTPSATITNNQVFISEDGSSGNVIGNNNVVGNHVVISSGRRSMTTMTSGSGGSVVNVGANSNSMVNGYTVRTTNNETTVITPENTIYVNGRKVSGLGPDNYDEYRASNPRAPFVNGPGFPGAANGTTVNVSQQQPVVELLENSTVSGNIIFEGGGGKVLLHPGARITGSVEGGTVQQL